MTDESRGLISETARDLNALQLPLRDRTINFRGRADFGQLDPPETEKLNQLVRILETMDIEQQRPARIRRVRHMNLLPRQIIHNPRIDRPKGQLALLKRLLHGGDMVDHPAQLDGGKVRRQRESGDLADVLFSTEGFEVCDDLGSAGVAPDDCIGERFAGFRVPDNGRLALVCDSDGGKVVEGVAVGEKSFGCVGDTGRDAFDDFFGIMFQPSFHVNRSLIRVWWEEWGTPGVVGFG